MDGVLHVSKNDNIGFSTVYNLSTLKHENIQ